MSAYATESAIMAAAVASAGGRDEWDMFSDEGQAVALEDARVMLQAALPHLTFDRRPAGEYRTNGEDGTIRWNDGPPNDGEKLYTSPPHVLPSHCVEIRQLLVEAIAAEKNNWTGDSQITAWSALDDMLKGFDLLTSRQPVAAPTVAHILRHAAGVLFMWEDDPNHTGYMGDFGDACSILELLAKHSEQVTQPD